MTQNHQTNNNEIEFLENIEQNMPLNKKQNFPKIISNGLVEINDPIMTSQSDSKIWSYIILEMLGDTVDKVFMTSNKITIPVALQIGI